MRQVITNAAQRRGRAVDEAEIEAQMTAIAEHFDRQHTAFYTSGHMLDHGIIDPRDTRKVLGFALETCWEARKRKLRPNSFGIARM